MRASGRASGSANTASVMSQRKNQTSDLYRDLLPVINSRKIDLLDHSRLIGQLCSLERRTSRGGRDSIDHAPGAHDDLPNAVAGLAAATRGKYRYDSTLSWVSNDADNAA